MWREDRRRNCPPREAQAVTLLALVAGQDVEPVEGSDGIDRCGRTARRVASDRAISTVDPDAQQAHETVERRLDGFGIYLLAASDTGLITSFLQTRASGPDTGNAVVGIDLLAADASAGTTGPGARDSAHGTGPSLPPWPPPGTRR